MLYLWAFLLYFTYDDMIWTFTFDLRNHWYNMLNDVKAKATHHESFGLNIIRFQRGGFKISQAPHFIYALSEERRWCRWLLRAVDCKAAVSLRPWPAPLVLAHNRSTQRGDGAGVGRRQELLHMSTEGNTLTLASPEATPYKAKATELGLILFVKSLSTFCFNPPMLPLYLLLLLYCVAQT